MQLARPSNEIALLRYRCWFLPAIFSVAGLILLGRLVYLLLINGETRIGEIVGTAVGTAMFAMAPILFYENNIFIFDLGGRLLIWKRNRLFRTRSGVVPFDEITSVVVDILAMQDSSNRLVIVCRQERIPVSDSYSGGNLAPNEKLAAEIQDLLGVKGDITDNSIRELVASGNKIEAMLYARKRLGISLWQAHTLVDALEELKSGTRT